jgi:hypothetical protein
MAIESKLIATIILLMCMLDRARPETCGATRFACARKR